MGNSVLLNFSSAGTCACMGPLMAGKAKNAPGTHFPVEGGGGKGWEEVVE